MDIGKDVYVCKTEVEYGRRKYSPDAKDEKSRVIKLPTGTPIDETIKTCFEKQGTVTVTVKPEEATAMDKDAVIESLTVETLGTLEKKFEKNGFDFDGRWNLDTAKEEFDKALMKKEEK